MHTYAIILSTKLIFSVKLIIESWKTKRLYISRSVLFEFFNWDRYKYQISNLFLKSVY